MARSSIRRGPSHINSLAHNFLGLTLFVSSLIVAAITFFFIYHLTHDNWPLPWTFILTAAVALLTVALVPLSALIHCCHTPNPTHQVILSAALLLGWTVSFALLSWNASATITTACNVARWGEEGRGGHMICRIYKAQYAFALFAFLSALVIFILDQIARRRLTRRGAYNRMDDHQQHLGWDGKGRRSHDDPWSVEAATELHGYSASTTTASGTGAYQPLDESRHGAGGGYADVDDGVGLGEDTGYRGRGHLA